MSNYKQLSAAEIAAGVREARLSAVALTHYMEHAYATG